MSLAVHRIVLLSALVIFATVQNALAFVTTPSPSLISRASLGQSSVNNRGGSLRVSNTLTLYDDADYVRNLEDKLVYFSKIVDDDVRRNDFETFVTDRLREEISMTPVHTVSTTVQRIKLKSLDFVQAMDKSILKLGQSAQDQGWESHVTSGFQPVQKGDNDIWPYVDMLIQFKLLISNMERSANKKSAPVGNGCKCKGCPGLGSCKDGKTKLMP